MPENIVMIFGLNCGSSEEVEEDEKEFRNFASKACGEADVSTEQLSFIGKRSAGMTFSNVSAADAFAEKLVESCAERNRVEWDERQCRIFISIDGGPSSERLKQDMNAKELLDALRDDDKTKSEENLNITSQVLITVPVFNLLPWKRQDLYGSAEEVRNIPVHRRFPADALQCFVISPIGAEGSEVRDRANYVFETYIKPACDGTDYRAVRGDAMTGAEVMDDIRDALQAAPMAIAYLGGAENKWNANVIWEVGFRQATGLPIVFVRDSVPESDQEIPLPFDLKDQRVIELPPKESDKNECDDKEVATKINTIRKFLKDAGGSGWEFPNACASVVIYLGSSGRPNRFTEASRELEELFEMKNIAGSKLEPVIKHLMNKMPDYQRAPFSDEQNRLIKDLIISDVFPKDKMKSVDATVPIVFKDHKKYKGRAFKPIIGSFARFGDLLRLKLLYIDVTSVVQKTTQGHYVCQLMNSEAIGLD